MDSAILALEDGTVFEGRSFGAPAERSGEVVFNTAITGYQEIFTDPSYAGQIVVLTYPEIGNYGANTYDQESFKPFIEGLVVREFSSIASNWRSEESAGRFLAENGIPVIAGIDTRALVRHLRTRGVMRGILATGHRDPKELIELARRSPSMTGLDLAPRSMRSQIASAINVVIQLRRFPDGTRRVVSVQEIEGMEGDVITMQEIYRFEATGLDDQGRTIGRFAWTGIRPRFFEAFRAQRIPVPAALAESAG